MASNENVFKVRFTGDKADLEKAIKDVGGKLHDLETKTKGSSSTGNLFDTLKNKYNEFKGLIIAGGITTGLAAMIKNAADSADELYKMSQKTGVAVEQLSTLSYVADLSGLNIETLNKSLVKLNRNIYDSINGGGEAGKSLDVLGISAKDASGKIRTTDQILLDISDKFQSMPNGIEKTALATKLFGKAGAELIPMLNSGKSGIMEMQEEARKLGLEISTGAAKKAEEFNDNLDRIGKVGKGVAITMGTEMMPVLAQITGAFAKFNQSQETARLIGQGLGMALKIVVTTILGIVAGATTAGIAIGTMGAALAKLLMGRPGEAMQAVELGLKKIKQTALDFGSVFKTMWGDTNEYESMLAKMNEQSKSEEQIEKAKKLSTEWKATAKTIQEDIVRNGLHPQLRSVYDIEVKIKDLKEKYKEIPGAIELIEKQHKSLLRNVFDMNKIETRDILPLDAVKVKGGKVFDLLKQKALLAKESIASILQRLEAEGSRSGQKLAANLRVALLAGITTITPALSQSMDQALGFLQDKAVIEYQMKPLPKMEKPKVDLGLPTGDLINFIALQEETADTFAVMSDAASAFYELSGQKAGVAFTLYKAFAISEAAINTYQSAVAAYKSMVGIPVVGPGLAVAAAAAATAFGLARIAQISSMQPGSRGGGVSGGTVVRDTGGRTVNNNYTTNTSGGTTNSVEVKLELNGSFYGDQDKFARDIKDSLQRLFDDGLITVKQ